MLALNVTNRGSSPANHVVPMTAAEMAVLRSIANVSGRILVIADTPCSSRCLPARSVCLTSGSGHPRE